MKRTYRPSILPLLASTTRASYEGTLERRLLPAFGGLSLRDLSPSLLQEYFTAMKDSHAVRQKTRDALASVLNSASRLGLIQSSPLAQVRMPRDRRPRRAKSVVSPVQFMAIVDALPEPYSTMVYLAGMTGLRPSEVVGLKWRCVHSDSISVEERHCRGDWSSPKTTASAATIDVPQEVIDRIMALKKASVVVKAGLAKRKRMLVRHDGPDDLVFQAVYGGGPINEQNVMKRHVKPAARLLGIPGISWQALRRSHATWLIQAGADPKSAQAQMRHSRATTTMEIYAQATGEGRRKAVNLLSSFVTNRDQTEPEEGSLAA